ncbi:hypothetical protein R1sor_021023 [Riccia sorocarpa]|uniref:Uncharacterized protein n=1 Tax=Riccia sorocarpa TaxID=122646 RepID=A0ABD3GIR7_9MARC
MEGFALLGVVTFVERHHPLPKVEDGKADQTVYDINTYWPTVCHSYDTEHVCTELCQDLGSHICAVYSNDGTADGRYVSHVIFPLPKAVQEKLRLAELEGLKIHMPDWSEMMGLRWQPSFEEIVLKERSWRGREAAKAELQDALQLLQRFRDFGTVPDLVVTTLSLKEKTSLATWDCANKTADEVRIAVADLLVEVETEVRQAALVYVQYLMKIFRGTSTGIPRWEDAEGFVADKFEKMQS